MSVWVPLTVERPEWQSIGALEAKRECNRRMKVNAALKG